MNPDQQVEHFFRHEYGRLVSALSSRIGVQHIEDIEDAVQTSLMTALDRWPVREMPENPSAWLYRVAYNNAIGTLRQRSSRQRLLEKHPDHFPSLSGDEPAVFLPDEIGDDLLRMLFVCCDDTIPVDSQLVLALKVLCGFGVREIATSLFLTEANVYKRLGRARQRLRDAPPGREELVAEQYASRRPAVLQILYLMFTEGHLSSHSETSIRRELCGEAMRLTGLLAAHPVGMTPDTFALLALMHLHSARINSRRDPSGGLLLLEEQDRQLWDHRAIQVGLGWLSRSAEGDSISRYHVEAGIAAEHCLAPSFHETRWQSVVESYDLLERIAPSAIYKLNRAVAVAEWKGPEEALALLCDFEPPTWLAGSYVWSTVLSDLNRRCGNDESAASYRDVAISSAPTSAIREVLRRRLRC